MENNDWLKIEDGVLMDCSLDARGTIVIPDTVTRIEDYTFYKCSRVTSINMPNSVTRIGKGAFFKCSDLKLINIPSGVTEVGEDSFFGCKGLTSIEIPSGVTSIGNEAFYDCSGLTSISISDTVTSIGHYAFSNCTGLKSINIPDSVTHIGYGAFSYCTSLYSYPEDGEKVIAYKGFDYMNGKLMCRGRVYSLTDLNTEPDAKICKCGIHACMLPIDVLNYYDTDYIYKVEMSGKFDYNDGSSKICATEMRILERIDKEDLIKETIKIMS